MNINAIQQDGTLLRAFTEMVRKNLEAELLEQIKPALRMAVDQAVGELEPSIRTYYDLAADQLLIKSHAQGAAAMSLTPMPRWSKDTEVFVRPSHFHAGPGVVEIHTRYKDLNNVQHAPVEHIAEATEAALRELAYEVGRRAVFA